MLNPLAVSAHQTSFESFDVSDGRCGIIVSIPDHCFPFYLVFLILQKKRIVFF